ncbi:MAG: hypothetical protein P4L54_07125 [Acidocella sp.]|nr:hypothetical protein [Acidocella sp.]
MAEDTTTPEAIKAAPKKKAPYGLQSRTTLTPGPPFTLDELRKVLEETKGDLILPGDAEILKLANILTTWKQHFYAAQEARALNERLAAAESAIKTLREIMPEIYKYRAEAANAGDPFSKPMAKAARKLLVALDYPDKRPLGQPPVLSCVHRESLPEQVKDWRWLVNVLPIEYENLMRPANPTAIFGHSKTGPLACFLAKVIPRMTGETRTEAAIGTQLIMANRP